MCSNVTCWTDEHYALTGMFYNIAKVISLNKPIINDIKYIKNVFFMTYMSYFNIHLYSNKKHYILIGLTVLVLRLLL